MRILGVGNWNDLGHCYLQLAAAGHEVKVFIADPAAHDILEGMVDRVDDWAGWLPWIREAGDEGLVLFENADMGHHQDALRTSGFQVIGGSAMGDRLENDRDFGQDVLRHAGMSVLESHVFSSRDEAAAYVRGHPGRHVVKCDGPSSITSTTYVGRCADGSDVVAYLARMARHHASSIQLTPFVDGVEVGVGAYFNGLRFLLPACLDWEHKGFFPGNLGEQTGEMGTLLTYEGSDRLFDATLAPLAPILRESGYVGYINLNTIVNPDGVWPLEFTARFGYPGSAILSVLQPAGWADLFRRMLDPSSTTFPTSPGYAIGVVLTVPPFPYPYGYDRLGKGSPIILRAFGSRDNAHLHLNEVAMRDGGLVCSGLVGSPVIVTGTGRDAFEAQSDVYSRVAKVVIPNMRYRNDIGTAFIERDHEILRQLEWMVRPVGPGPQPEPAYALCAGTLR